MQPDTTNTSPSPDLKGLLDLACERTTTSDPFFARHHYEQCLSHANRNVHLAAVEKQAKQTFVKGIGLGLAVVSGFIGIWIFLALKDSASQTGAPLNLLALVSVMTVVVGFLKAVGVLRKIDNLQYERRLLEPIGDEHAHCIALKEMVLKSTAVAHYIKLAIERNEQLTLGDAMVAHSLLAGEEKHRHKEQAKVACLELHLLATAQNR